MAGQFSALDQLRNSLEQTGVGHRMTDLGCEKKYSKKRCRWRALVQILMSLA